MADPLIVRRGLWAQGVKRGARERGAREERSVARNADHGFHRLFKYLMVA